MQIKVLKSRWNFVKAKTTTPGNNIYTLLRTFIAFTSFTSLHLFSHTNSHITLGPPVVQYSRMVTNWHAVIDCKTIRFFRKSVAQDFDVRKAREPHMRTPIGRACEAREREKKTIVFLASLPSLAHCFQPRSRPFVLLLARTWIRKNTDCFAV